MAQQQQIAASLSAATTRLQADREALAKLRMQKQGFMQELQTAKVRFNLPTDARAAIKEALCGLDAVQIDVYPSLLPRETTA